VVDTVETISCSVRPFVGRVCIGQEMFDEVGGVGCGCIPGRNAWVSGDYNPGSVRVAEGLAFPTASIVFNVGLHVFVHAKFSTDPCPGNGSKAEDTFDIQSFDDALVELPACVREFVFAALEIDFSC